MKRVQLRSGHVMIISHSVRAVRKRERGVEREGARTRVGWRSGEYINRPVMMTAEGEVRRKPRSACSSPPSRTSAADYLVPPGRILGGQQLRPSVNKDSYTGRQKSCTSTGRQIKARVVISVQTA